MRSESTRALGQPRETKPTLGVVGVGVVDMTNLGVEGLAWPDRRANLMGALGASDQKVRNSSERKVT
ncbi:hypothetical protein D3C84_928360 [compost metagenome]